MNIASIRLKSLRKNRKLTQQQLADRIGIKRSAIAKYENGLVESMKTSTIKQIANFFGVSPLYLTGMTDDEEGINEATDLEKEIMVLIPLLSQEQQEALLVVIKSYLNANI